MNERWYQKLGEILKRQAPHPREMMIMVLIIMFLFGKLIMLYIDQMPVEEEGDYYYFELEDPDFIYGDDLYGEEMP